MLAHAEHELEQCQHQVTRLENRIRYTEQRQRRDRTHRPIIRGAAIESIVPSLSLLSEPQFYELMDTILHLPEATALISSATKGSEPELPSIISV